MSKLTLKSIAAHFDVSISTVSKAINDSHEISDQLKTRIQSYAQENHYRPNKWALNLLRKNTKTIAVVLPNILNYFFVQVLYGMEKMANAKGYSIVTCITNESYEKEIKTLDLLRSDSVDGMIVSTVASESMLDKHAIMLNSLVEPYAPSAI